MNGKRIISGIIMAYKLYDKIKKGPRYDQNLKIGSFNKIIKITELRQ
jgi:hypothetical protein